MVTKKPKSQKRKLVEIDLDGPNGNVFYLLGVAHSNKKLLPVEHKDFVKEATSGNYAHAVKTFDKYLGKHFNLVTSNVQLHKELTSGQLPN